MVLDSLGRYEEAVKCFDECTNLSTELELDLVSEAWYRKGLSFYSLQTMNIP